MQIFIDDNQNFSLIFNWNYHEQNLQIDSFCSNIIKGDFFENLLPLLSIKNQNNIFKFDDFPIEVNLPFGIVQIWIGEILFAELDLAKENFKLIEQAERKLSVFETRLIGRSPGHYIPKEIQVFSKPLTDLHTHLSGQVNAKNLIEIGLKHHILYPTSALSMLNVDYSDASIVMIPKRVFLPLAHLYHNNSASEPAILLNSLSQEELKKLEDGMSLSSETQSTFEDIEKCYYLREPFTKELKLLPDILMAVALEFKEQNIKYVELSTNALVDLKWLKIVHEQVPIIEERTGVILRFLLGIPRNLSEEPLKKRIKQIKNISISPLVVGVDLLGYEINKTSHLETHLALLAAWVNENRPGFIFRIHAGENAKNPTNVKDALLFALEHKVRLRIGHAIYGIDEETIELAKFLSDRNLLIIEFNPDSNLATNNIDFVEDLPIRKFLDARVKCVIGSDGAGLYQTSSTQVSKTVGLYGLTKEDAEIINETEKQHIADQEVIYKNKIQYFPSNFFEIISEEKKEKKINQVTINEQKAEPDYWKIIDKRIPILIAGATGSSWLDINISHIYEIKKCLNDLVNNLDPEKVYFVTGRSKDKGISVELGKIITMHNFSSEKKFLYASMVAEREENSGFTPKSVTIIKEFNTPLVYLPSGTISYLKEKKGLVLFIGGRSFTRDFILESIRQDIDFALMNGPEGASTAKARIYPNHAFNSSEELIKKISKIRPEILKA